MSKRVYYDRRRRRRPARNSWTREQESRTCRQCEAEPGSQCATSTGRFLSVPHMARYYDAGGKAEDDMRRDRSRQRKAALKKRVLDHYGTACACCGATEGLTIDHIAGDGKQHREAIGLGRNGGGGTFYRWLIRNNFPEGFQTLCAPCNNSKRNSDHCKLLHVPACPTCHRPFEEATAVDRRNRRVWSQSGVAREALAVGPDEPAA